MIGKTKSEPKKVHRRRNLFMKNISRKLTAMASAMAMALCALPTIPAATASAEDEYNVRDPFFNFSSKYHYYE